MTQNERHFRDSGPVPPAALQTPGGAGYEESISRARDAERRGDTAGALQAYESALACLDTANGEVRAADTLRYLGSIHRERGETDRAERRYRESYRMAERISYVVGMAQAANWLAVIAMGRGCLTEAAALFRNAQRMSTRSGQDRLTGAIEQNLGILANIRGDLDAAVVHYRSALNWFRTAADEAMLGLVLNNLGLLYNDLQQWEQAGCAFDEAFELAGRTGNRMLENSIEVNRAELHLGTNDLDAAHAACLRARSLAQTRADRLREAEALKFLGAIARERGAFDDANRLLEEAAGLASECDDRLLMAEVAREIGELCVRREQRDQARVAFCRALDLFRAVGARLDGQRLEERMARLVA
jgi:tetratricopeptide (TPR) repeat protein